MRQGCRVTPGWGNPRESATENRPPCICMVRVKRWGKSPPRDGQPDRHGKPHPEQCRIGISRGHDPDNRISPQGRLSPRSGLAARPCLQRQGQMNGHPWGFAPGTKPGLQTIRTRYANAGMKTCPTRPKLPTIGLTRAVIRVEGRLRFHGLHATPRAARLRR